LCITILLILIYPLKAYPLKAGSAKAEITPDLGVPLNGYGARLGKGARAVHDPLWVHVLYLNDDQTEVFIVSLDLCVIDRELRDRVIAMAPDNISPTNIIMTATHTHNGFGGMCKYYPIRFVSGRYIPELIERTARIIAQTLREAKNNAKNAVLGYGTIQQTDLTCNRRYSGGPMDPQVGFIVSEDANGNEIAIVANMAGHPTSIGDEDFFSFSADYPGYFYREIEKLASPGCVPLFLNGAEGNQTIQAPENTSGWARTEKVGQLLAQRIYDAQKSIPFSDVKLKFNSQEIDLPMSIAEFFPKKIVFQSLQINDLAISFFPGELCVEYALQLRELAIMAGFKAHFTVGLSNDYLLYFVPKHLLFDRTYEAGMHFFGPQAEQWVINSCLNVLGAEQFKQQIDNTTLPEREQTDIGISIMRLTGTPYQRGLTRGRLYKEIVQKRYEQLILSPVKEGKYLPEEGLLSSLPTSWIDASSIILPAMAISIRPWASMVHPDVIEELTGLSDGTEVAFDKIWLLQNALNIKTAQTYNPLFDTPLCTAIAVFGERAGAKDLLIGHTIDWAESETPTVFYHQPNDGIKFVEVSFPWFYGTLCGMNEAGIVLSVTRDTSKLDLSEKNPGPEFTLKHILSKLTNFETVISEVEKIKFPAGYHTIIAGKSAKGKWVAQTFPSHPSEDISTEALKNQGVVLGCGSLVSSSETTVKRYSILLKKVEEERIISTDELKAIMTFSDEEDVSLPQIWNEQSRCTVIFEPTEKKIWITIRRDDGKPSSYISMELNN